MSDTIQINVVDAPGQSINANIIQNIIDWSTITGRPSAFNPSDHTQDWSTITSKPSTFPPSAHTQDWSTITNKPSAFHPTAHKSTHATGGTDALTPADIGAASLGSLDAFAHAESDAGTRPAKYAVTLYDNTNEQEALKLNDGEVTLNALYKQPLRDALEAATGNIAQKDINDVIPAETALAIADGANGAVFGPANPTVTTDWFVDSNFKAPIRTALELEKYKRLVYAFDSEDQTITDTIAVDGKVVIILTHGIGSGNCAFDLTINGGNLGDEFYIIGTGDSPFNAGYTITINNSTPLVLISGNLTIYKHYVKGLNEQWVETQIDWDNVLNKPSTFEPSAHTHASTDIADSTTFGRTLLTAENVDTQRTALGLGDLATQNAATPPAIGRTTPNTGNFTSLSATRFQASFGTLTASNPFQINQTWNNAATVFNGLQISITDTASNSNALPLNVVVGGTSRFSIRKDGYLNCVGLNSAFSVDALTNVGTQRCQLHSQGWGFLPGFIGVNNCALQWSSTTSIFGTIDLVLLRDAANTLAQVNGVNAQTFRLYNTFTNASNYERGFIGWTSNALRIGTEALGTGSNRNVEFYTAGTLRLILDTNGLLKFGGTTSAFPALKRSGTTLQVRRADDTDWGHITAGNLTLYPFNSVTPSSTRGEIVIEATSNTTLSFKMRGYDDVIRTGTITLS